MSATRLIEGALDKVRGTAGVKTVYGEPIKVDGKTIIPIATVAYGAGAGAGAGPAKAEGETQSDAAEGAGVGAYAAPVGVVEISEGETKFVAINSKKKIGIAAAVGAAAGMLAGLFMGRGRRRGY
jgi:uncharacterized spore protein YtfJ